MYQATYEVMSWFVLDDHIGQTTILDKISWIKNLKIHSLKNKMLYFLIFKVIKCTFGVSKQWRSEDVWGPWTMDFPRLPPRLFLFCIFFFSFFSLSLRAPSSSGAPGHCPPMPPTCFATVSKKKAICKPIFFPRPYLSMFFKNFVQDLSIQILNLMTFDNFLNNYEKSNYTFSESL